MITEVKPGPSASGLLKDPADTLPSKPFRVHRLNIVV